MRSNLFDQINDPYAQAIALEEYNKSLMEIAQEIKEQKHSITQVHYACEELKTFSELLYTETESKYAKKATKIAIESAFRRNRIPSYITVSTEEDKRNFIQKIIDWILEKFRAFRDWVASFFKKKKKENFEKKMAENINTIKTNFEEKTKENIEQNRPSSKLNIETPNTDSSQTPPADQTKANEKSPQPEQTTNSDSSQTTQPSSNSNSIIDTNYEPKIRFKSRHEIIEENIRKLNLIVNNAVPFYYNGDAKFLHVESLSNYQYKLYDEAEMVFDYQIGTIQNCLDELNDWIDNPEKYEYAEEFFMNVKKLKLPNLNHQVVSSNFDSFSVCCIYENTIFTSSEKEILCLVETNLGDRFSKEDESLIFFNFKLVDISKLNYAAFVSYVDVKRTMTDTSKKAKYYKIIYNQFKKEIHNKDKLIKSTLIASKAHETNERIEKSILPKSKTLQAALDEIKKKPIPEGRQSEILHVLNLLTSQINDMNESQLALIKQTNIIEKAISNLVDVGLEISSNKELQEILESVSF